MNEFRQLQAFNAIRDARAPFLRGGSAKSVLYALASFAGADGWAWPSLETLGAAAGLSKRSTGPIVDELAARGVLELVRGKQHASNRYRLRLEALRALKPSGEEASPLNEASGEEASPLLRGEDPSPLNEARGEEASPLERRTKAQRGRTREPEGKNLHASGEATSPEGSQEGTQEKEERDPRAGDELHPEIDEIVNFGAEELSDAASWAKGITDAIRNACTAPSGPEAAAIVRACPPELVGRARSRWLRQRASDYARANPGALLTGFNFALFCKGLLPSSRFPIPAELPLTDDARKSAAAMGVCNVDDEWIKFRAHHVKVRDISDEHGWYLGAWPKWCVDAKRFQLAERSREASRAKEIGVERPYHAEAKLAPREKPLTDAQRQVALAQVRAAFEPPKREAS